MNGNDNVGGAILSENIPFEWIIGRMVDSGPDHRTS